MSRSRIALMAAWGLLAIGAVLQFAQSSGEEQPVMADQAAWNDSPGELTATGQPAKRAKASPIPPPRSAEPQVEGGTDRSGSSTGGATANPATGEAQSVTVGGAKGELAMVDDGSVDGWVVDDGSVDGWVVEDGGREGTPIEGGVFDNPAVWANALPRPPAVVATVIGNGVASRTAPGSSPNTHWFDNPTQFGGPRAFLVLDDTSSDRYVKVSLPVMPNGQEGWLPRSAVELSTVTHRAEVDLSEATVTVWDDDEVIVTTRAVTGRPSTPTPLGRFFVRDIIAQPNPGGDYGPWILALSGFSEVLETFDGGLPALALHGTDQPAQIGRALSSGCIRVPNKIISTLAEIVPLGTPVTVVA